MMIGQQYYTASVTMKVENLTKVYSSALSAGLAFAPMGVLFLVISGFLSARFVNRFGVKPILISGMTLQTIGYLLLSRISLTESYFGLLGPMLVIAVGTGLGFTAINIAALTGTRRGEERLASGSINTSRQIGGPIGIEIWAI
jgi:fucose permease